MRYTILVATLSAVVASVLTTAAISGSFFGADTASSANTPVEAEGAIGPGGVESILQGDLNCDGVVDTHDTLGGLRFLGELDVQQTEPCPDIGTLAAIPGPAGPAGAAGPEGPAGPAGPQGEQGPAGISEYKISNFQASINSDSFKTTVAFCPDGQKVIGGGAFVTGTGLFGDVALQSSYPTTVNNREGWRGAAAETNSTNVTWSLAVRAICANVAE